MKHIALTVLMLGTGLALSLGMASLGEPSAVWLWRDMLGVLR